jgi:hypothetical protein
MVNRKFTTGKPYSLHFLVLMRPLWFYDDAVTLPPPGTPKQLLKLGSAFAGKSYFPD